jgi:hypothetical protein
MNRRDFVIGLPALGVAAAVLPPAPAPAGYEIDVHISIAEDGLPDYGLLPSRKDELRVELTAVDGQWVVSRASCSLAAAVGWDVAKHIAPPAPLQFVPVTVELA